MVCTSTVGLLVNAILCAEDEADRSLAVATDSAALHVRLCLCASSCQRTSNLSLLQDDGASATVSCALRPEGISGGCLPAVPEHIDVDLCAKCAANAQRWD